MWGFVLAGPLAILGIEFGWIFSCVGRQPWTIYRIMTTEEAVTTTGNMGLFFIIFVGLYVLLSIAVIVVLRTYFKKHPLINDLEKAK
jgi:cytochrome d ubiquinol oxidase subunit I